jgi:ribosome biogenesis SPOUT family RNA methylase Rps3
MARKTYIVEHLDEELGPWSELEYVTIAKESHQAGSEFCLSSVPSSLALPDVLQAVPGRMVGALKFCMHMTKHASAYLIPQLQRSLVQRMEKYSTFSYSAEF